jgi:hypothetical protein
MILYQFAQDVAERDVAFLNPRSDRRWNDEGILHQPGQLSAGGAGPSNRRQATVAGRFDTLQHIGRISARADADGDIALSAVRPHLAGEQFLVPIVVRDAGDRGNVRRQGDGGQGRPIAFVSTHEFRGDMCRVGRASAVTEQQDLIAVAERAGDERCDLHDPIGVIMRELLFDPGTVRKSRQDNCLHRAILGEVVRRVKPRRDLLYETDCSMYATGVANLRSK